MSQDYESLRQQRGLSLKMLAAFLCAVTAARRQGARTMRRFIWLSTLGLALLSVVHGQSIAAQSNNDELIIKKNSLLADLQALEAEALKLEKPLALAIAKAEVAATAWTLDETWAKKLLTEAYELTFPPQEARAKLRNTPPGAKPIPPTADDRAQNETRNRVLQIAGRDRAFADSLALLSAKQLGPYEAHFRYASLADRAFKEGHQEAASQYLLQSIEADPTQITSGFVILDIAAHDRPAADKLILQYIERLRAFPLSASNQSALRVYFSLRSLVFPQPNGDRLRRVIPAAGSAVIRAYVAYVIESIGKMEQSESGSAHRLRGFLLEVWLPLKQYAPELTGTFFQLEKLSRRPGDDGSLPQGNICCDETVNSNYEDRVKKALNKEQPDEEIVYAAITRRDFERARKLLARLPDGAQKTQLTDTVNTKEAISLAARGDITGAETLAGQLTRAVSMLEAYPAIIKRCVADKNQTCVSLLVYKAVRQLKRADLAPHTPPAGIPMSVMPSNREFDPALSSLSKLASLIAPLDEQLALEVLDEVIAAANSSALDTEQGRTGLDVELFRKLSLRNDVRVRQSAESLKDRLRRIVALSAIYQARVAELAETATK